MGRTPERTESLARPRERRGGEQVPVTNGVAREKVWPEADPTWHAIARMLWDSARVSGQEDFYQQSDIALLYSLCDDLSRYKNPAWWDDEGRAVYKANGQILATIYSSLSNLLITEGDRRRVRLELQAPPDNAPSASVAVMADYRSGLSAVPDLPKTD